jgi:hypothetical protein
MVDIFVWTFAAVCIVLVAIVLKDDEPWIR